MSEQPLECNPFQYQYLFFQRSTSTPRASSQGDLGPAFTVALQEAWQWATGGSDLKISHPPIDRQITAPIAHCKWTPHDGGVNKTSRLVAAYSLLDTLYIQLGEYGESKIGCQAYQPTAHWTPPSLARESQSFLGGTVCVGAELHAVLCDGDLDTFAAAIARSIHPSLPDNAIIAGARLKCGFFALLADAHPEMCVFLYGEPQTESAGIFANTLLPPLLLCRLKTHLIRKNYHQRHALAREQEEMLDACLKEAATGRATTLRGLETLSTNISRQQWNFNESISDLEEDLHTINLNVRNMESVFLDLGDVPQHLRQETIGKAQLLVHQMEADLRYLYITQKQANFALESIQTETGVRSSRLGHSITFLLSLFGLLELWQCFPADWSWQRWPILAICAALLWFAFAWLLRR